MDENIFSIISGNNQYNNSPVNHKYFDDVMEQMRNNISALYDRVSKLEYENENLKKQMKQTRDWVFDLDRKSGY
jgi:predicted site-specific integrase-resolvase